MTLAIRAILSVLCILCISEQVIGAKILAIVHMTSYSHQVPFRSLWIELHKRGHEVTLITPDPTPNINSTTIRQIVVDEAYGFTRDFNFVNIRLTNAKWLDVMKKYMLTTMKFIMEAIFNHPEVRQLYAPGSKEKFDVVLIEMYYAPALFAFGHRFNAPVIGLSPLGLLAFENYAIGGVVFPSHESSWEMEKSTGSNLSFWERLTNFYALWYFLYSMNREHVPYHQNVAEKYMGKPMPPVMDLVKNVSVVFVEEDPVMSYARPQLSNVITFHSIHVSQNVQPLPTDLRKFIESAKHGFIYFSLGTIARFDHVPVEIQRIFFDVFGKLPYNIVIKSGTHFSNIPENIYVGRWFSQQSILGQPNIKLFMYQGGLQSTQEAIHFGVPLLGFPILADQEYQMKIIQSHGIGKRLAIEDMTRDDLESTIKEIITNKEYKENSIKLARLINDTPCNSIENLVWWTEYIIRHKGARHLRTNLAWVPWYQHYDMDVFAFLVVATFILFSIGLWISMKLLTLVFKINKATCTDQKKKRN